MHLPTLINVLIQFLCVLFIDYQPPPPPPPPPPPEKPPPPLPDDEPGGDTDELIALPRPLDKFEVLALRLRLFHDPLYQAGCQSVSFGPLRLAKIRVNRSAHC
jgi:hypothetical protein